MGANMQTATNLRSLSANARGRFPRLSMRCPGRRPGWLSGAALALLALLAPAAAAADVLSLYAAVQGGGAGGQGVDGEAQDEAFHAGVQGLAYGALVGAEVLFIDGWVEHTQHMRDGSLAGTWTQFMVGFDTQIDLGGSEAPPAAEPASPPAAEPASPPAAAEPAAEQTQDQPAAEGAPAEGEQGAPAAGEQGAQPAQPVQPRAAPARPAPQPAPRKPAQGYAPGYIDLGLAAGFGVGTGQQVMPPLDNGQLTDKGFLGQVHVGLGYRLSRALSLGVRVPVQAGYLFKTGEGAAANDRGNQYVSVNASVLVELRLNLSVR
jgi:hypothetical protein